MTFGERIKEARKRAGLTQAELAERIGTTMQNISQYERSIRSPRIGTIKKIAEALNVPVMQIWDDLPLQEGHEDGKRQKQREHIMSTYDSLTDAAQDRLVSYADDLAANPSNIRSDNK